MRDHLPELYSLLQSKNASNKNEQDFCKTEYQVTSCLSIMKRDNLYKDRAIWQAISQPAHAHRDVDTTVKQKVCPARITIYEIVY